MSENKEKKVGIFIDNDGRVSSRIVLSFVIIIPFMLLIFIVCIHWSFKAHPLPEYTLQIIMRCLYVFTPLVATLMGCQSYENSLLDKLKYKRKENGEK